MLAIYASILSIFWQNHKTQITFQIAHVFVICLILINGKKQNFSPCSSLCHTHLTQTIRNRGGHISTNVHQRKPVKLILFHSVYKKSEPFNGKPAIFKEVLGHFNTFVAFLSYIVIFIVYKTIPEINFEKCKENISIFILCVGCVGACVRECQGLLANGQLFK